MRTTFALLLFGGMAALPSADAVGSAAHVPRLYVIGDSTAASYQPDRYPRLGWAQELQQYFDAEKLIVENKARSGRSAKSFFDEGAWAELQAVLTDGDYVLIQFGHNDSKKDDPARFTEPETTYRQFLKTYIEDTRAKGATPILATSINRNRWDDNAKLEDTLDGYPPAMRSLALELDVPLIDLHAATRDLFEQLGPEKAKTLFMNLGTSVSPYYPDGAADNTHLSEDGAHAICRLFVAELSHDGLPLAGALRSVLPDRAPAFPGAEGFGKYSLGGRGGRVVFVTNLNDAGPGSLRDACCPTDRVLDASGLPAPDPRTVIFRVAGTIDLQEPIEIRSGRVTIAGQTAPGSGICLRGVGFSVKADDVVIRYVRVRPGDVLGKEVDGISVSDSRRVMIDHCSVSWAVDELMTVTGASDAVTVQWCFITEALENSVHKKGPHSMGSLLRSRDGGYSFHHNLYAHNRTRNPRPGDNYDGSAGVTLDFRNNVIYDWGDMCGYGVNERFHMNYVGNLLKPGPSTQLRARNVAFQAGGIGNRIFLDGNVMDGFSEADADNWKLVAWDKNVSEPGRALVIADEPFAVPAVETESAPEACDAVLRGAGAIMPKRDKVDARVAKSVRRGIGRIIDSQCEVGAWPAYRPATPPRDSDDDGMPDAWERRHHLDRRNAADAARDADGDGYTNLEDYLNALAR